MVNEIKITKKNDGIGDETHEHPSFGMIRVSKCSGSQVLNGSSINHQHFFTLTIQKAEKCVSPEHVWWFGREPLIEIKLSSNQLMDMLINSNTSGIPCTLGWLPGIGSIPNPPQEHVRQRMRNDLKNEIKEVGDRVIKLSRELEDKLKAPGTIKKKDKEDLAFLALKIKQTFEGNIDFLAKCQEEHLEKIITQVGGEVEATVSNIIRATGIKGLEQMLGKVEVPLLNND